MFKKSLFIFIMLVLCGTSFSQVKNPKIARSWWSDVKEYIDQKAANMIMVFDADSIANQTLAIANLNQAFQISRIDITTESVVDSPTVFYFQSGAVYDSVLVDSSVTGKYYFSSEIINFPAAPCTLRFDDSLYSYRAKGGGNVRIIIQFSNR